MNANIESDTLAATRFDANAGRREQLINATILAIADNGLSKTTLARVAALADLSPGIVNFYFKSKDELLLATLAYLAEGFDTAVAKAVADGSGDPVKALQAIIAAYLGPDQADVNRVAVWFAFWGESQARREYLRICGESDAAFDRQVRELLDALPELEHADTEALGSALVGLLDSLWQQVLWDGVNFDRERAARLCRQYLHGIAPQSFPLQTPTAPTSVPAEAELPTLARWTYTSAEFFALEQQVIFKRQWMLVGHVSEIANPGDYMTLDIAGERALVIRDQDGQPRAFHNVCRHRGSCVVPQGNGHCDRLLVCPFHGWAYGFDGALRGVPAQKTFPGLDKSREGLVPVELEIWQGFAFVRFHPGGPSVAETMAPVDAEISAYRLPDLQPLADYSYEWPNPVNWKLVHDIDNEGYHVPIGHPSLQTLYGQDYHDVRISGMVSASYGTVEHGSSYWSVARYQNLLPRFEHLPEHKQRVWAYYSLFPNAVLAVHPEMVEFYQTIPLSANETLWRGKCYGLTDERREIAALRYLNRRINGEVSGEDEAYFNWLGEGMASSVFPRDRFSTLESGVLNFHEQIRRVLPVARLEAEPEAAVLRDLAPR